jgi:hypothetical protein
MYDILYTDKTKVEIWLSFELCLLSFDSNVIFRRISDLKGTESSPLPQLNNLTLLNRLWVDSSDSFRNRKEKKKQERHL